MTLNLNGEIRPERDEFRAYYITEYKNGTSFIHAAYFASDEDKDNNLGATIIFVINEDINDTI